MEWNDRVPLESDIAAYFARLSPEDKWEDDQLALALGEAAEGSMLIETPEQPDPSDAGFPQFPHPRKKILPRS